MNPRAGPTAGGRTLADPTRRAILDLLRVEPRTTGALAGHFDITRYGVMKHLTVLAEAGLLRVERRGRERWNHLNPVPIQRAWRRWVRPFEAAAADKLLKIESATSKNQRAKS